MSQVKNFITRCRVTFHSFLACIFGQISWTKPRWLKFATEDLTITPRNLSILGVVVLILAAAIGGYLYYEHLPRPNLITATITPPAITPKEKILKPQPLVIDFSAATDANNDADSEVGNNTSSNISVAPLSGIGKPVSKGISLSPNVAGQWVWQNENELVFTPQLPWPAGTKYTVSFAPNLFGKPIHLTQRQYSFTTIPFNISIKNFQFYLDLQNPNQREAVADLNFNYPVNSDTLKSHIRLFMQALKNNQLNLAAQEIPYQLSFDTDHWHAYIHADISKLPNIPRYMQLYIERGVSPQDGVATDSSVQAKALIPDQGSVLRVNAVNTRIVRNSNDQPEQVLTVETSVGVTSSALAKALHVYVLPKDLPATSYQPAQPDYSWSNPGDVTPALLTTPLTLTPIPAAHEYDTLHSYKFKANSERYLYISLDQGLPGYGDFTLAQNYAAIAPVPQYPKEISFLHKGALLALNSDKKFSVVVRGIPAVKFSIARILPDDINHFVTQTIGEFQRPQFLHESFGVGNISEIFSEIQQFNDDPDKAHYIALNLGQYLAKETTADAKVGLFLLKAQSWNVADNTPGDTENDRFIVVTDMGLLVKNNQDGSHDVFVQSITQGTPVANATVSVLGKNGLVLLTKTTDQEGHVHFPNLESFKSTDQTPTLYLARQGNDISFIPYDRYERQLNYSRFDVSGAIDTTGMSAFLFSDRGIYRPGDEIHIGMIVKGAFIKELPAGLPLEVFINDPRGNSVLRKKMTLNADGYLTLDYQTAATALTGQYSITLYTVKDNQTENVLGSTAVSVEEFQPDKLKIRAHFQPEAAKGWVAPSGLKVDVGLWNLYGTPATQRRIAAKLLIAPQTLEFAQYPEYTFINPLQDPKKPLKSFSENLPDAQTDAKGEAEFNLNLDRFSHAIYKLTFFAEGFAADGGRGVSTEKSVLVSPLPYLVGYKPDADLNYIKQNGLRSVNFMAVASDLKSIAVNNLQLQLFKLNTISTLTKQPDGTYQYQSVEQQNLISSQPFPLTATGTNYVLPTKELGNYRLVVTDDKGLVVTKLDFLVIGASQHPLAKNAELSLKLNKANYAPGETIEMQINAPYAGAGLITIERDKVYAFKWFKMTGTSTVQSITIPKDFVGTGYVNVALMRDWDSDEIYMSPLSYSVAPFSVIPNNKVMDIDLNVPTVMRPGKPLTIAYHSDQPGKIIIYAVDKGILQVAAYETPDPLDYYFRKQALTVNTAQIVDQILPKFITARELSAFGGDEEKKEIVRNLNPFKRKDQPPVVYWSGIVDTDQQTRQLTYQVPDYFNGTLQVMAVAAGLNAVGSAHKDLLVQDYFILTPNAPTFVAPGDTFDVSVTVANNDKEMTTPTPINIALQASDQLQIVGPVQQQLTIAPGSEKTLDFQVRVLNKLGAATLTFTATADNKTSQQTIGISVRPAMPFRTKVSSGYDQTNKTVAVASSLYPEYRQLTAAISTNPLILVGGLENYLNTYPYGCTEQLVSKAFVQLAMTNQPAFHDSQKFTQQFNAVIQLLRQRQTSSGGFAYWPQMQDNSLNQFATVYAMDFLTTAKARGYTVPDDLFAAGINYLKDFAITNPKDLNDARVHAYAIYVLTRNEIVTTNYITNLQLYLAQNYSGVWDKDITSVYLAAAYKLLKNDKSADLLIAGYQLNNKQQFNGEFYDTLMSNAQYLTILARYFPEHMRKLGAQALLPLVQNLQTDTFDSLSAAYSALALSSYAETMNSTNNDNNLAIKEILTQGDKDLSLTQQSANFDSQAQKLQFITRDNQGYFYQITQAGFDEKLPTTPLQQSIEIYKEYRDLNNKAITTTTLGSEIEVHISVRALAKNYLSNIAIVDLLPGGFAVVPHSVAKDDWDYVDVREDRVIFYGGVGTDVKNITYRIRAINKGQYTTPPVYAAALYNPAIQARGIGGEITVR